MGYVMVFICIFLVACLVFSEVRIRGEEARCEAIPGHVYFHPRDDGVCIEGFRP